MFSHFFIRRPKSAFVLSILITLAGLISLTRLPVSMYPEHVTPPVIEVSANYPGASATVVEQSVIQPLEEAINGVKDMAWISSRSGNDGSATIEVYFKGGTNPDINTVNVQNRISRAAARLPSSVNQQGVTVRQGNGGNMVMGINVYSPKGTMNPLQMSSYVDHYLIDTLSRVKGVSKAFMLAEKRYSMRIWLDPGKMHALKVTVQDVESAIREQNASIAAGSIGAAPSGKGQSFEYAIQSDGRLSTPGAFGNIIIRADSAGGYIRLHDVATVRLGSENYEGQAYLNNKPTVFVAITQLPDASALSVASGVKKALQKLEGSFPRDLKAKIIFDTTEYIDLSVHEVIKTLLEAIILVILVVFIFLQNWRATLIPTLAIPVSIIGTFAFMNAFGIAINLISLFALVLSIGIVVDDAIIVIENVERHISEGMAPESAAYQSMKEISGPILATTFVLLAVFGPVAFIPGISGQLFREFSAVLSISVLISAINALTLSPALCATLLTPGHTAHLAFMRPLDRFIKRLTRGYNRTVGYLLQRTFRVGLIFLVLLCGTGLLVKSMKSGFIPDEDSGYLFVNVQLPDAASLHRTDAVIKKMTEITLSQPGVSSINAISGFSVLSGNASNSALGIIVLDNWSLRENRNETLDEIKNSLQRRYAGIPNATIQVIEPPAINAGDDSGGFSMQIEDATGSTPQELARVTRALVEKARAQPELENVFTTFRAGVPMYRLELDRMKAKALGVSLNDAYAALQAQMGSLYVNDFDMDGKIYQVIVEADSKFREKATDLRHYHIRNDEGTMISLAAFARLEKTTGAPVINHFNLYRSATIKGQASEGYSSSQALKAMERIAKTLPAGYTYEWSGSAAAEMAEGSQVPFLFVLAILFVYLILVALYESWSIPLVVLAVVPVAIFGATMAIHLSGIASGVYVRIGMLLLIGMTAKSTILMAEFAVKCRGAGQSIIESAKTAAKLRFRAVFMTSLSFMLGVAPLIFSGGPGANSRFNIGITITGGMLTVTTAGILLTPVIYLVIQKWREKTGRRKQKNP